MNKKKPLALSAAFGITIIFIIYTQRWVSTGGISWSVAAMGAIAGVVGALWLAFVLRTLRFNSPTSEEVLPHLLQDEEYLLKQGKADHVLGEQGVQGTLLLTNKRLLFISNRFSKYNHQIFFPLGEIAAIRKYSPKLSLPFIFGASLEITLANMQTYRFAVHGAEAWVRALHQLVV